MARYECTRLADAHELVNELKEPFDFVFTDAFEIAHKYSWDSGSLFSAVYHRIIKDQYMRIFSIDDSDPDYEIVNRIYQNTGRATNSGIELLFSQDFGSKVQFSASFNGYENTIELFAGTLLFPLERSFAINESSDTTWDAKVSGEFKFRSDLTAQLTGVYFAKRNIPQGKQ